MVMLSLLRLAKKQSFLEGLQRMQDLPAAHSQVCWGCTCLCRSKPHHETLPDTHSKVKSYLPAAGAWNFSSTV